jgi:hypothetical protein
MPKGFSGQSDSDGLGVLVGVLFCFTLIGLIAVFVARVVF